MFFDLPNKTVVGRVVPKNAFDKYINTKQKKLLTDCVLRITWTHKLSPETANLNSREVKEIQVFKVELKKKVVIPVIIEVISKVIPYQAVFWVEFGDEAYLSTAAKHAHPTNEDLSVIDWVFTTDWFALDKSQYRLILTGSLDSVFKNLCVQISGKPELEKETLTTILQNQQEKFRLECQITKLKKAISNCKQFNEKIQLNLKLKKAEQNLKGLA